MSINCKYLKDESGEVFSPITSIDSIFSKDGENLIDIIYPIGSIFMSTVNKNPQTYLGGTWVAWGSGRVPVGVDTSQTEFDTVEKTGGEKTHKLIRDEIPAHSHSVGVTNSIKTGTDSYGIQWRHSTQYEEYNIPELTETKNYNGIKVSGGGDVAHNNLQPYITCYMYKRTA